jgi:hypothetical protein
LLGPRLNRVCFGYIELLEQTFRFPPTNGHERRPGAILKAALLRERACATKDGNQAASEA